MLFSVMYQAILFCFAKTADSRSRLPFAVWVG